MALQWWQRAVFYQIYPRSFADSNGDGIGDLDGITAHLDYLNDGTSDSLGIDAIWLGPINPSPLKDWGYDVSDYYGVHPELGTIRSLLRLIAEAHRRDIRVILDLVPNHTSDQHPWFIESRSSRANPKRDWYLWVPGEPDRAPSNWLSAFGGSAWSYDEKTASWYLHSFLEQQPDLNYRNPRVVEEMGRVIGWWAERGVDGFRVDAISHMLKDAAWRDNPQRTDKDPLTIRDPQGAQIHLYDQDRPEVHEAVRAMRRALDQHPGRMMVGEVWPREQRALADYLAVDELHLAFNFRFFRCPWRAAAFRDAVAETEHLLPPGAWPTYTLSNHDFPRHITRYAHGGDAQARARVAAMLLMTLRGTPFIYYGEEIGMTDARVPFPKMKDPVGRDSCRTPMQWSGESNGGFSTARATWLPPGDFATVNVERQRNDPASMLSFYRRLIALRRHNPALVEGDYLPRPLEGDCMVFERRTEDRRLLIALNFGAAPHEIEVPAGRVVIDTASADGDRAVAAGLTLAPDQGVIVEEGDARE